MIRLAFFGTSTFGLPSFEALRLDSRCSIVGVISQPAKPVGRRQVLTDTPVSAWAKQHHLPCLTPATLRTDVIQQQLVALQADVFVVAAYGLILPTVVLSIPPKGCINIHASLLPRYRGASPIAAALAAGDDTTGVTMMVMDAGCDTGPVLCSWPEVVQSTDTRPELEQRLSVLAAKHIVDVIIDFIDGTVTPTAQDAAKATTAPKLTRQDGQADWRDAIALERRCRAYTPWPGLWTTWQGREFKILSASANDTQRSELPGTVIAYQDSWAIVCQRGVFIPTTVQLSGRRPQRATTIPGSYPEFIGSQLGQPV